MTTHQTATDPNQPTVERLRGFTASSTVEVRIHGKATATDEIKLASKIEGELWNLRGSGYDFPAVEVVGMTLVEVEWMSDYFSRALRNWRHDTEVVADANRTRRALALTVEPMGRDVYRVSGGAGPHEVRRDAQGRWTCDCQDSRFNPGVSCKHRLARYLASALDTRVLEVLRVALG
jgi:hypothetical protein